MKSILIVEDEVQICEMMADLFESKGYITHVAHSGNDGAKIFNAEKIDIVLSDVKMPNGDGFELARLIAEKDPDFNKIIFVTGYLDAKTTPLPGNVRKFFKKPAKFSEITTYIEELLEDN